MFDQSRTGAVRVCESPGRQLPVVHESLLVTEKSVAEVAEGGPLRQPVAGNPAREKFVLLFQPLFKRGIGIGELAEVVGPPFDFLAPASRRVRGQRKIRMRLGGLVMAGPTSATRIDHW